jgi:hypothetical protein
MSREEPLDGTTDETQEPEPDIIPTCPPGEVWDGQLGRCVPEEEPPPPPPPEPQPEPEETPYPWTQLPFPFNLIDAVLRAYWDAVQSVAPEIADQFTWLDEGLKSFIGDSLDTVSSAIVSDIATKFSEAMKTQIAEIDLTEDMNAALADFDFGGVPALNPDNEDSIFSKISSLQDNLGGLIEGGTVGVAEALQNLSGDFVRTMRENLEEAEIQKVKDKVISVTQRVPIENPEIKVQVDNLQRAFSSSPDDFYDALEDIFTNIITPFISLQAKISQAGESLTIEEARNAQVQLASAWAGFLFLTTVIDGVIETVSFGQIEWLGRTVQNIIWALAPGNILKDIFYSEYGAAVIPKIQQAIRFNRRPHRLRIQEITQSYARGNMSKEEALDELGYAGLADEVSETILENEMSYPTESEVHKLFYRGLIDADRYAELLRKSKLPDDLISTMQEGARPIPGASDLVRFTVKEDLGTAWLNQWLSKQGYSEEWAAHYWNSHWELPSVGQAYDLLARGEITEDQLVDLMVKQDLHPDYRDGLFNIRFNLIPRVDLRRAYAAGVLTFDELVERYKFLGYKPEDALLEAQLQTRETLNAEINSLRTSAMGDYREGYISLAQLRTDLEALEFNPEEIELSIAEAERDRANEIKDEKLGIQRELVRRGKITLEEYRQGLEEFLVDQERIVQLVALEEARRRVQVITPVDDDSARVIRSELTADYVAGYMTVDELQAALADAGFNPAEVDAYANEAELRYQNKLRDDLVKFYTEAFRKDQISEAVYREALSQVIVRPEKVDTRVLHELARKRLLLVEGTE